MKEEFRPDAWHNAVGPKPVIKAGDRVKVVRGFNVGARGTVLRVSPNREAQSWDCWVRRDLAGDSDEMGYRFDELVVIDAEIDPIAKYFDKAAAKRAERDEQLLVMAGVKQPDINAEGRKDDTGKLPYDLIAPEFLAGTAEILAFGAAKYAPRNWEKGMAWSRPFSALMRHMWAWWAGEKLDPETGKSHLWHACCCLMFLVAYEQRNTGTDDRPNSA